MDETTSNPDTTGQNTREQQNKQLAPTEVAPPVPKTGMPSSLLPAPTQAQVVGSNDEKMWAAIIHASGACGWLGLLTSIPFVNILLPLVIWLIKKNEMPYVRDQGKEVLNYQISWSIYAAVVTGALILVGFVLLLVLVGIVVLASIPFLLGAYALVSVVFSVIGAINASDGQAYRYPLTIRFIK